MSNISLIIEERAARIGRFMVGHKLPFRQKRMDQGRNRIYAPT